MNFFLVICLLVLPCAMSFLSCPINSAFRAKSRLAALATKPGKARLRKGTSFFNSLSRKKEEFVPIQEDKVSFYR